MLTAHFISTNNDETSAVTTRSHTHTEKTNTSNTDEVDSTHNAQVFPTSLGIGMSTKQAHVCGEGHKNEDEDEKVKNGESGRVPYPRKYLLPGQGCRGGKQKKRGESRRPPPSPPLGGKQGNKIEESHASNDGSPSLLHPFSLAVWMGLGEGSEPLLCQPNLLGGSRPLARWGM